LFSFFVSEVLKKIILLMLWECELIIHAFFFLNSVNKQLFQPFMSNYICTSLYNISNLTTCKVSCSSDSLYNFMEEREETTMIYSRHLRFKLQQLYLGT